MRKSIFLFLSCICILNLNAFAGTVKLHGRIKHPISDSIMVRYSEEWVGFQPKAVYARLAKDGSFSLSFPVEHKYTRVDMIHGNQRTELMPSPGDDLEVALDASNFDSTLAYKGKGAAIANFVARHVLDRGSSLSFMGPIQPAYIMEQPPFKKLVEDSVQAEQAFTDRCGKGLTEAFTKAWMADFRYQAWYALLQYPTFHEVYKQHSYTISHIPEENYKIISGVPAAFDDNMLNVSAYRRYIDGYFAALQSARYAADTAAPQPPNDAEIALYRKNMPPASAEQAEAENIYDHIKYAALNESDTWLAAFVKRYPGSAYTPKLKEAIVMKRSISAGSTALDFTIHTTDGKTMKLSDLKGKVVYLDFWASWCGPCAGEMPHAKNIEEKYKDKDVVFLYVSIDEDEASWKKAMVQLKVGGINMRDGGKWNGAVANEYNIRSIPAYFLIGRDGRYAADVAPRPTQEADLAAAIDKLLQ